jgi:hypothetical protein
MRYPGRPDTNGSNDMSKMDQEPSRLSGPLKSDKI